MPLQYLTPEDLSARLASDASFGQPLSEDYKSLLEAACTNATAIINAYIGDGRTFAFETLGSVEAPITRRYTGDGSRYLFLDVPLQTFVSADNNGAALTPGDVILEPANSAHATMVILRSGTWTWERQGVQVTGVWGWGTPPAEVVEATAELAVRIVKGRAAGYSDTIGINPDGTQQYVKALPPLVKLALDLAKVRYRQPEAGATGLGFGVA